MSSANKKQVLRQAHINEQRIVITEDDHRNNPNFLRLFPNTIVKGKKSKVIKTVGGKNSIIKNKVDEKNVFVNPTAVKFAKKDPTPRNAFDDDIFHYLSSSEEDGLEIDDQFLFHEIASEDYDLEVDLFNYSEKTLAPTRNGTQTEIVPKVLPPSTIYVDTNSLIPQIDALDGTITFKASVYFEDISDVQDYDVIVTQVVSA